ncbi:MAG: hypothetical protein JWQ20_2124 [Conexibacter sp.]|nr:hypothetical protein [Conexibacter sp.]
MWGNCPVEVRVLFGASHGSSAPAGLSSFWGRKDNRVFSTVRGRRFSKSTFHYAWNPVRSAFGRPGLDWHELRHFTATYLIEELRPPPRRAEAD